LILEKNDYEKSKNFALNQNKANYHNRNSIGLYNNAASGVSNLDLNGNGLGKSKVKI